MLLVLAHEEDLAARRLAARWADRCVLLTPADAHRHVWHLTLEPDGTPSAGVALDGDPRAVDAVLTRLGGVRPAELRHVRGADREYAAAELTAFLLAWLDAFGGPVVNRPAAGSLNGPAWSTEQWLAAATEAGLRVRPDPAAGRTPAARHVTLVGTTCSGPVHPRIADGLRDLARSAGVPLLHAVLDGPGRNAHVIALDAWPDVADEATARHLAGLLAVAS